MAVRLNKIAKELGVGISTLGEMLRALGYTNFPVTPNSMVSEDMADLIKKISCNDLDFIDIIKASAKNTPYSNFHLKIVDYIDLDKFNNPIKQNKGIGYLAIEHSVNYTEKQSFYIDELVVLSPNGTVNQINVGTFSNPNHVPLYSLLIGSNGVGKSLLMKEIVDFFIDLHLCKNGKESKMTPINKIRLRGIRYHIDGLACEVIRLKKTYLVIIDGNIHYLSELRLPSIVACHFGAFDKFPTQRVDGSAQTKYDVPYYKYVGAHVNGSIVSSSAIAFRLLFSLNKQMDEQQRKNMRSILDFIGYDHTISLQYSFVMKSKKDGAARDIISRRVEKDRDYQSLTRQEKNEKVAQLYNFYKNQTSTDKSQQNYELDLDKESEGKYEELQLIYKLKQYDLVSSANVIFHKHGDIITSEEMSSGEFTMLSTILSISAAANNPHTLILLDEPELSQHPNWQMSLIDNLDRALANHVCHLLIATHSHMLVSDLPMNRSNVTQLEKDKEGNLLSTQISECTYGWSAEEVLLKVFKTATDRNRYFGERIVKLLEQMGDNTIEPKDVADELKELQEISVHLSDVDPMKAILNTIVEAYK